MKKKQAAFGSFSMYFNFGSKQEMTTTTTMMVVEAVVILLAVSPQAGREQPDVWLVEPAGETPKRTLREALSDHLQSLCNICFLAWLSSCCSSCYFQEVWFSLMS